MTQTYKTFKATLDKVKAMTADERTAYFETNKGTAKPDLFANLVTQNIITQAQADSIKATFTQVKAHDKKVNTKKHNVNSTSSAIQTTIQ